MAKSTKSQEVSTGTSDSYTDDELNDPAAVRRIVSQRPQLGEVDRNKGDEEATPLVTEDGTDSSPSSGSGSKSSGSETPNVRQHAPTTESHSSAQDKGTPSGARSTGTSGRKTTPQPSAKKRANSRTEDDLDEFDDFD
jgi:hypothetical protein